MSLDVKNKRNRLLWLCIVILALLDLVLKWRVFHGLWTHSAIITPLVNPGGAWSLAINVSILIAITIIAVIGLIYLHDKRHIDNLAFVLITAWALGNVYDRVTIGWVRDWIHLGFFPVFNLADIMITIGVVWLALHYHRQSRKGKMKNY